MATEETTADAPEEVEAEPVGPEQPTASEELAVYQEASEDVDADTFEGVTDAVPGAVTDLTPDVSKKMARAEGPTPLPAGGWAQLADTDNVADLGVLPGTRVQILNTQAEIVEGLSHDPYHPVITLPEDGDILVRTRDAAGQMLTVTAEDLEPVAPGVTKG